MESQPYNSFRVEVTSSGSCIRVTDNNQGMYLKLRTTRLVPKRVLCETTLFVDGIPAYYDLIREGIKFRYSPSYENVIEPLPRFTIWNDGFDWLIDSPDIDRIERETITLAIQEINNKCLT